MKINIVSVLAALHSVSIHPERVSHYQRYRNELNFNGIEFPVNREGIKKFERLNPSISTTVIGYERGKEFPYYIPDVKKEKHVTLLYWSEKKKSHYAWIKNLNRFLSNQTKTQNRNVLL